MKIAIYGAGAIGGFLGALLHRAGADVSLIARGEHLAAIQKNGLTLEMDGEVLHTSPRATDNPAELGPQDYVIVALKAHASPYVVDAMQPLLDEHTAVVTAMNGIPWWYFYRHGGDLDGRRIESVDPDNRQWDGIGPERAIGCVVYPACDVSGPGVIKHINGNRFALGEPDGEKSERVLSLSQTLIKAGLRSPIRSIRDEIWVKLWGNLCFNPISTLTTATLDTVATDPGTRSVARSMMLEAQQIGESFGIRFEIDVEKRIDGAAAVGAHKTSMLQDLQLGRPMEIDALLTSVQELGRIACIDTPTIDTVLSLVQQRGRVAGLYE
ncbi:MAG: 2-dehydropantoate 2-reductase [Pseudomonadota bacterium]